MLSALAAWSRRRWLTALAAAVAMVVVVGVPTVLIPNPIFGREIPPTAWAWPALLLTSALGGLLLATYVREPGAAEPVDKAGKAGGVGGLLAYFAIGCPVCNKLVLLALGYSGALQWFAPAQPLLAAGGIVLLAWALRARLRGEVACRVAPTSPDTVGSPTR